MPGKVDSWLRSILYCSERFLVWVKPVQISWLRVSLRRHFGCVDREVRLRAILDPRLQQPDIAVVGDVQDLLIRILGLVQLVMGHLVLDIPQEFTFELVEALAVGGGRRTPARNRFIRVVQDQVVDLLDDLVGWLAFVLAEEPRGERGDRNRRAGLRVGRRHGGGRLLAPAHCGGVDLVELSGGSFRQIPCFGAALLGERDIGAAADHIDAGLALASLGGGRLWGDCTRTCTWGRRRYGVGRWR